ncbi:hypothetical protein MPTK1_5g03420 [Marchantia polymorpha subsp. ruderalis]|uniref:Uncharacterized protein n=2 Tax=Marchantia polymorpha TaxID=3197 RepID=A0AAF6BEI5_MARPO|nr:hypothetical protein MARPO_0133s0045 [Marchantia polymorpha]BBN10419.1 hypothetical protein Mp_5g03420 [Marchantia polymorpha subsp. ruderalis]|eukprot:PTQ29904.1 hypothetical protein MARPO_0133s0045 [Marchantia polymorpha]
MFAGRKTSRAPVNLSSPPSHDIVPVRRVGTPTYDYFWKQAGRSRYCGRKVAAESAHVYGWYETGPFYTCLLLARYSPAHGYQATGLRLLSTSFE